MDKTYRIYDSDGITVERVGEGSHANWAVYVDGELLCLCVYKKGAMSLVNYINKLKRKETVE